MKISVTQTQKKNATFRRVAVGETISVQVDSNDEFYVRDHDHKVYGVIQGVDTPLVLNGGLRLSNRWSVDSMRKDSDN